MRQSKPTQFSKSHWRELLVSAAAVMLIGGSLAANASKLEEEGSNRYEAWGRVLTGFVDSESVDYRALAFERRDLDLFLGEIATAIPGDWAVASQTAFWINAYNAAVISLVLDTYPHLDSVKKVDGFFDESKVTVAGEALTLDEIQDRALATGDARVHFAIVCAAVSCPPLRGEPYSGDFLDAQLEDQTRTFLADSERGARYDPELDAIELSTLFKWYGGDFSGGSTIGAYLKRSLVVDWVRPYLPASVGEQIRDTSPSVRYLDYDWTLNDR